MCTLHWSNIGSPNLSSLPEKKPKPSSLPKICHILRQSFTMNFAALPLPLPIYVMHTKGKVPIDFGFTCT